MRTLRINPDIEAVEVMEVDGNNYKAMNEAIGIDTGSTLGFTYGNERYYLWLDDNGVFASPPKRKFYCPKIHPQPLIGQALIYKSDGRDGLERCDIPADVVAQWLGYKEATEDIIEDSPE